MALETIGNLNSGKSRKSYAVKWDASNKDLYVDRSGTTFVGKASSPTEAMRKAEAFLYDK
ncbi:MAG: hypothetical protein WC135_05865 [Bacteroidales bacterium]